MSLKNPPFGQPYTFDFLNVRIFTGNTFNSHSEPVFSVFVFAFEIYHISYFIFNRLYFRHDI